jgi:hypothetical protein
MFKFKCRELTETELSDYAKGMSVREISMYSELSPSSIRHRLEVLGVLRGRLEAVRMSNSREIDLDSQSRLTAKENGTSYAAKLSQLLIRQPFNKLVFIDYKDLDLSFPAKEQGE